MTKQIRKVKVVSSNFIIDIISKIQNMFGVNLNLYEDMINKGLDQIYNEIEKEEITMEWYKYETSPLTNGAIMIIFYGESK